MADENINPQEDQSGLGLTQDGTGQWSQTGERIISQAPQRDPDPVEFWRANHNDPAYRKLAEEHQRGAERLREIREKAALDAQTFDRRYTFRQKARLAQIENEIQAIKVSPDFDDNRKERMLEIKQMEKFGIIPSLIPRTVDTPKGQGIGDTWLDPRTGAIIGRDSDGKIYTVTQPNHTVGYLTASNKQKLDAEQAKHQREREKEIRAFRSKHSIVEFTDDKYTKQKRNARPEEIDALVQSVYGAQPGQPIAEIPSGVRFLDPDHREQPSTAAPEQAAPQAATSAQKPSYSAYSNSGAYGWDGKSWVKIGSQ
jgi:hypothetical protein